MRDRAFIAVIAAACASFVLPEGAGATMLPSPQLCSSVLAAQATKTHKVPSAAYVPGVNVHGKPVASANVAPVQTSPVTDIPLTINLALWLGEHVTIPTGTEMNAPLGTLHVTSDGRVLRDDGSDLTQAVVTKCKFGAPAVAKDVRGNPPGLGPK